MERDSIDPQDVYDHFPHGMGEIPSTDEVPGAVSVRIDKVKMSKEGEEVFTRELQKDSKLKHLVEGLQEKGKVVAARLEHNAVTVYVAKHKKAIIGGVVGAGLLAAGGVAMIRRRRKKKDSHG